MRSDVAEVVIVGGGIIGSSTSYYLAKKGISTILLEAGDIASGTSGSCDRAIMIQSKNPGLPLKMAMAGLGIYRELEDELGADLEFGNTGGMILIECEDEMKVMEKIVRRQREAGIDVRIIGRDEAMSRQPAVSPHIIGATYWDGDADVNPIKVCFAMGRAARMMGADVRLNCRVTGFLIEENRVTGVRTCSGEIKAEKIIIAAGVWTPELGKMAGIKIPIIPRRGQILVSEKLPPLINGNILSGRYIACKHNPELAKVEGEAAQALGIGLSLGQTSNGNLLIGGTREFVGNNRGTTPEAVKAIAENAVRLFPVLKKVRIIRSFAGLRPYTPDGLPVLGPVQDRPGLFIAAGHEGDGIALGPITGRLMADMVTGTANGWDLSLLSPNRFHDNHLLL